MTQPIISEREKRLTLYALLLVFLLGALDSTIVGTAMPRIIQQLHGFELYAWVTTSYLLCSTVVVPIYGKLGDIYGRKSVLVFGVTTFLVGSALCGLSGEFGTLPLVGSGMLQLVIFRAIQGLGSAALFSLSFTIIGDLFTARERGRFMGLFGATFALASAIGPLVGGFLTDHGTVRFPGGEIAGWRWVFYVNLPLGLCSLLLILAKMPPLRPRHSSGRVDYLGALLFVAASIPLLLVLSWGGHSYSWSSPQILGLTAIGLATLALFVRVERTAADPLLPLSLFANRVFVTANLAGFFISMSFLGVIMFMPLFTQVVLGLNATQSGWAQMPLTIGLLIGSMTAGNLATRSGQYKPIIVGGSLIMLGALLWLAVISTSTSPFDLSVRLFLFGIGFGPSQSLFNLAVQNAVPASQLGIATGASQFFRQMGSVIGLALFGALLTGSLTSEISRRVPDLPAATGQMDLSQIQSQALDPNRMRRQLLMQAHSQAQMRQAVELAARLEGGMKESFAFAIAHLNWIGSWIVFAAILLTLLVPAIPLRDAPPVEQQQRAQPIPVSGD